MVLWLVYYGLLWGIVASCFGLLGFPGRCTRQHVCTAAWTLDALSELLASRRACKAKHIRFFCTCEVLPILPLTPVPPASYTKSCCCCRVTSSGSMRMLRASLACYAWLFQTLVLPNVCHIVEKDLHEDCCVAHLFCQLHKLNVSKCHSDRCLMSCK